MRIATGGRTDRDMFEEGWYFRIGAGFGLISAIVTFFASWWYCTVTYGYLLGFGLGWLPSLILAVIVFFAVMLLWGPALLLTIYLVYVSYSDTSSGGDNRPSQTTEVFEPSETEGNPEPAQTVALDATLQFASPSECIAKGTLERIYKKLDTAMDAGTVGFTVKLDEFTNPLPVTASNRTDEDGIFFAESSVRFPNDTTWNGLSLSRLKAEVIAPPESDSVYARAITFLDPPVKVQRVLNRLGFDIRMRPDYTALPDTYNSCGGSMQLEAIPGGSSLSCGWGC
jgi:hypothetical protein